MDEALRAVGSIDCAKLAVSLSSLSVSSRLFIPSSELDDWAPYLSSVRVFGQQQALSVSDSVIDLTTLKQDLQFLQFTDNGDSSIDFDSDAVDSEPSEQKDTSNDLSTSVSDSNIQPDQEVTPISQVPLQLQKDTKVESPASSDEEEEEAEPNPDVVLNSLLSIKVEPKTSSLLPSPAFTQVTGTLKEDEDLDEWLESVI